MRIAIFGATSEIAKDLIISLGLDAQNDLTLYARRPSAVRQWVVENGLMHISEVSDFDAFPPTHNLDAIINFVGIGNPAQARLMGVSVLKVTQAYDELALRYLRKHSSCKYIFLSSGAVHGSDFKNPVETRNDRLPEVNDSTTLDWYTIAKRDAELRHRLLEEFAIVDLRVFNYFSHTQDMSASYLMAAVIRAVRHGIVLKTSTVNIVRDYMCPFDFGCLIQTILREPHTNSAFDCYTLAPVDKFSLLAAMSERYGLTFVASDDEYSEYVRKDKLNYYSLSRLASKLGYTPTMTSLECILSESEEIFNKSGTS